MTRASGARWRDAYLQVAAGLVAGAPTARPVLTSASACVDAVVRVDAERLSQMVAAPCGVVGDDGTGAALLSRVMTWISRGRGGELLTRWPGGPDWIAGLLGPPDRYQLGGTGPQASWTLATVGAASVLALTDRSAEQLAVIEPRTGICADGKVVEAGSLIPFGAPTKLPHCILEFSAGTRCGTLAVPRSSRIILRFSDEPVERDGHFLHMAPALAKDAGAGLLSGLNSSPEGDTRDRDWVATVARAWSEAGLAVIHHELSGFPTALRLREAAQLGFANSLGLSLSELFMLAGKRGDPRLLAQEIATSQSGARRVIVHADDWSLAVHQEDPQHQQSILLAGNALASARAREGQPTGVLDPVGEADYTEDLPPSGALGDGWRATCVPAPHLYRPASTVGLGDTFTAGVLLAESLDQS